VKLSKLIQFIFLSGQILIPDSFNLLALGSRIGIAETIGIIHVLFS
jgi:hypothetical protein